MRTSTHSRTGMRRFVGRAASAMVSAAIASSVVCAATVTISTSAFAQPVLPANCIVTPTTSSKPLDACQKVVDLFRFLAPQVGTALSGGNTMLGEGGTLGGPGKYSFSLHATVVDGLVPSKDVVLDTSGVALSSNFGAQRAPVPMPSFDVAAGLYPGVPVGLTNVGGVDLLLGLTYVPDVNKESVSISTDGKSYVVSYGVRVGILQESAAMPGLSVSLRNRRLPTSSFLYTPNDDSLIVSGTTVRSQAIRVVAAKRYKFIGVAAGLGRDKLESQSHFSAAINEPAPLPRLAINVPAVAQTVTRSTAFFNLSIGLPKAQLVGEMGWSSKGTLQETVNSFDGHKANEGYRFYSLGFGFRPF